MPVTFTATPYGQVGVHLLRGRIDFVSDDMRILLVTSSYTFAKDTHDFADDLTGELSTGGGYTSGGVALSNKTVTYDSGTDTTTADADDITITSSTLTWRSAILVDAQSGSAATNPLLVANVGNANTVSTGGDTVIEVDPDGLLQIAA